MILEYHDCRITGINVALPMNERSFENDLKRYNFPESRSRKLMEVMGYDRHRLVADGVCSSDLAVSCIQDLVSSGHLNLQSLDAMVVVTQTPDYLIPPTSSVIHGVCEMPEDMLCIDITQGCAGYLVGLIEAFSLLNSPSVNRVIVVNTDVLSRKVNERDRNSFPLIGDACAVTLVESAPWPTVIANIKNDGRRREALRIPAGGMRMPSTAVTAQEKDDGSGNIRSLDNLVMDGTSVLNFVLSDVPGLINELLERDGRALDDFHAFAFHQPNKFILSKLSERINLDSNRMPMDLVGKYGNSSGATIPVLLADQFSSDLCDSVNSYMLAGFGVGLTWACMAVDIGDLEFCNIVEV